MSINNQMWRLAPDTMAQILTLDTFTCPTWMNMQCSSGLHSKESKVWKADSPARPALRCVCPITNLRLAASPPPTLA